MVGSARKSKAPISVQGKVPTSSAWLDRYGSRLAFGLTAIGLGLRLVGLGARPLWFDEVISVVYARQDFGTLIQLNADDNHPPGYYLVLKVWIGLFGTDDGVVRLLSVWPGVASIWLVWLLGRQLLPQLTLATLVATALTALSPFQIYFSQEARNYSLLECAVLAATLFWLRGLADNRWRNWLGLGLAATLGLLCNFTTAFYLAALGLYCLLKPGHYWKRGVLQRLLLTGLGTALVSGLLLLPKLLTRLDTIKGNFWIPVPNLPIVLRTFYSFIFGATPADELLIAFGLALVLLGIVGWQAVGAVLARQDTAVGTVGWLLVGPLSLIIIVSYLYQPLYLDKALIGCAPFYYLLIGWAIGRPRSRSAGWILTGIPAGLALALSLTALPALYTGQINPVYIARYDAAGLNAYWRQHAEPGDIIVTATDISWLPLVYYDLGLTPAKFPIKEYPYPNIFPALLQRLDARWLTQAELDARHTGRVWLVLELNDPTARPLTTTPDDPARLDWLHSPDWQRAILSEFNTQHHMVSSIIMDHLLVVLYEN